MSPLLIRLALACAFAVTTGVALLAVADNERILREGRIVLAALAPVDPRSLMQGDYMALRFAIDDTLPRSHTGPAPDYAHLTLDAEGRATFAGVADHLPSDGTRVAMKIRSRDGRPTIGPNAFFFQEGRAETYERAQWGEFRVDERGKALLTHLRDEQLVRLGEIRR